MRRRALWGRWCQDWLRLVLNISWISETSNSDRLWIFNLGNLTITMRKESFRKKTAIFIKQSSFDQMLKHCQNLQLYVWKRWSRWDELLITSLCFEFDSIGQINTALLFKRLKACQIFCYQISACTISTLKLIPMKKPYNIWQAFRIWNWKDKHSLRKEDVMTGPLFQTNPL